MKIFEINNLKDGLLSHPYESNPDYFSKINPFYYSSDEKFIAAYYEAQTGWFDVEIRDFNQLNYIIEGEIEVISDGKVNNLKSGSYFLIEDNDNLRYKIIKDVKILLLIYPATEAVLKFLSSLGKENTRHS
jgi:ethanolamine utilization protein EutQ (cupin superfamily)